MSEMTTTFLAADNYYAKKGDLELEFDVCALPIVIPKQFHAALLAALLENAVARRITFGDDFIPSQVDGGTFSFIHRQHYLIVRAPKDTV